MPKREGFVLPLLLILIAAILGLFLLVRAGVVKIPFLKKEPTVKLQTQYQNPFSKESQYVNPFASYKNPFDALR